MQETNTPDETITISKRDLATYLDGMAKVRTAFILCAPRFAGGSFGEAAVVAAQQINSIEAKLANLINDGAK